MKTDNPAILSREELRAAIKQDERKRAARKSSAFRSRLENQLPKPKEKNSPNHP